MVTGSMLMVIFFASLVLVFGLIIWVKWEPFLALLAGAVVAGLMVGIPLAQLPGFITRGFGNTLGGIGITIGLGVMLGELLYASGATHRIAESMLKLLGERRSPLAVTLTGWVTSIPVFMDAAFVILIGLVKQLSMRTKISMLTMVTALSVGLVTTHAVVAPTPGPLVVAENMGINLGFFIMYAVIITLPTVLVAGWLYGLWVGRNAPAYGSGSSHSEAAAALQEAQVPTRMPGAALAFGLLSLPIVLILLNTIFGVVSKGTGTANFFAFVGEKNMALFISVIAAALLLRSYFKESTNEIYARAIRAGGLIILITGAGGAFGSVIQGSGIGDYLVATMQGWNMPVILLAFLFAQILRMAQGSTTVALVTTSSVLGPMALSLGASPMLIALAICAGGIGLSMPNDSGFWVVTKFSDFDLKETLKTWTTGGTIAGLTALVLIYILSLFQGVLPGM